MIRREGQKDCFGIAIWDMLPFGRVLADVSGGRISGQPG